MLSLSRTHRRLAALQEIHSGADVTQRSLARKLAISLGLANRFLHALEKQKLIKVNADGERRYVLTPAGRAAQLKHAAEFALAAQDVLDGLSKQDLADVRRRCGHKAPILRNVTPRKERARG